MTCFETALRWPDWQTDPVQCIARETYHHRRGQEAFGRELRALAALVSRHREEFDELMRDVIEIVQLDQHREPSRGKRPPTKGPAS